MIDIYTYNIIDECVYFQVKKSILARVLSNINVEIWRTSPIWKNNRDFQVPNILLALKLVHAIKSEESPIISFKLIFFSKNFIIK